MGHSHILIIDNEMYIRDIFSHFLSNEGYDIQVAKSNDDALEYIKKFKFDLILADINMAGMTFTNFLTILKGSNSLKNIPVIAVTGVPHLIPDTDLKQIQSVLEKPFEPAELLNQVKLALS